jgi:hypothetical protein
MYEAPNQQIEQTAQVSIPAPSRNGRRRGRSRDGLERAPAHPRAAEPGISPPPFRRLRGYAFDPSLSIAMETALVNEITFKVKWEPNLMPGPVGEYLAVVDYDPASDCYYAPVNLNDPLVIAQDGLPPADGNPQFHQQMVYAVAMTTIRHFEQALGRFALWASGKYSPERLERAKARKERWDWVPQLRIYPHALREANAYYSQDKVALLFGYFPASASDPGSHLPGGTVFTCLSHDIIAHETTHALLDGMHEHFNEPTNPDVLAFHEAFSDIVALFQRFSFQEVLRHQIAKTRGDLASQNLLGELAQQFGKATGRYGALRSAIGRENPETGKWEALQPDPRQYRTVMEPHHRGAILVAAVFDAFLSIYKTRVADLLRIATNGTGELPEGALHPDLVNRLAEEASKSAGHVLNMCIRALDYCPPVDITFGEYLRAIITADADIVPDDDRRYRVAFIEAFRRRGIYPQGIRTLSEESLRWPTVREEDYSDSLVHSVSKLTVELRKEANKLGYLRDRRQSFMGTKRLSEKMHSLIKSHLSELPTDQQLSLMGLVLRDDGESVTGDRLGEFASLDDDGNPKFAVYSVRPALRVGPDGYVVNHVVISMTQSGRRDRAGKPFRGGCTLILDLNTFELKYNILKPVIDPPREKKQEAFMRARGGSLRATYFGDGAQGEVFAALHRDYEGGGLL